MESLWQRECTRQLRFWQIYLSPDPMLFKLILSSSVCLSIQFWPSFVSNLPFLCSWTSLNYNLWYQVPISLGCAMKPDDESLLRNETRCNMKICLYKCTKESEMWLKLMLACLFSRRCWVNPLYLPFLATPCDSMAHSVLSWRSEYWQHRMTHST